MTNNKLLTYVLKGRFIFYSSLMTLSAFTVNASDAFPGPDRFLSIKTVRDISGHVTDVKNDPLAGATVQVKGTNKIVVTDANGNFKMNDVAEDAVRVISDSGYSPEEFSIAGKTGTIQISMKNQQNQLGEVVVMPVLQQKM